MRDAGLGDGSPSTPVGGPAQVGGGDSWQAQRTLAAPLETIMAFWELPTGLTVSKLQCRWEAFT